MGDFRYHYTPGGQYIGYSTSTPPGAVGCGCVILIVICLIVLFSYVGDLLHNISWPWEAVPIEKVVNQPEKYVRKKVVVIGYAEVFINEPYIATAKFLGERLWAKYKTKPPQEGKKIRAKGVIMTKRSYGSRLEPIIVVRSWKYIKTPAERKREAEKRKREKLEKYLIED